MEFDHSYAEKLSDLVAKVSPQPLTRPRLQLFNHELANRVGLPPKFQQQESLLAAIFEPEGEWHQHAVAQKYGGHQFGSWNPDLGDGRGLLLAECQASDGSLWDLHLKGAGQTPFSRFGDGRAVLRSTIREYLASEALHHLHIPTSRALCLFASDEPVYREKQERGAMLIRTCQSHLRFGHFEYYYHRKQHDKLKQLFTYTFERHFPELLKDDNPHLALLQQIVLSSADMIAQWQAFGFCHGVMNTDNMSIHGITFDFGPYAFLDNYDPAYICNHSDHAGRYAFDQQPGVGLWNLNALAHAFTPYLSIEQIKSALQQYEPRLQHQYAQLMTQKLGLQEVKASDMQLLDRWLTLLAQDKRDYTQSFRLLSQSGLSATQFIDHFVDRDTAQLWYSDYQQRLAQQAATAEQTASRMQRINPKYILRNYLAQIAIDRAEEGDFSECERLLKVLSKPFDEQPEHYSYAKTPPDWGQAMEISCSS